MDQVTVLEVATNVVEVAVPGPQGPTGQQGPQGIQGPPGSNAWSAITGKPTTVAASGLTDAESTTRKGAANGYAGLDSSGKVPAAQLPSYVDDVLEFANLAAFPATGSTGVIYVADDTGKIYRWSGSGYVEISPSPGSTDSVAEGTTNLYFTAARVLATVLTGFSTASSTVVTAADSVLSALGKLQAQVSLRALLTANTFTGAQTINNAAGLSIKDVVGTNRLINFLSGNLTSWNIRVTSEAQTGSDAGSNLTFSAYDDAGVFKKAVLAFSRATGIGTFSDTPVHPTPTAGDNSTKSATTAFVATSFAPLASPALTGNPTAPTATVGDNDTSIATTAFVQGEFNARRGQYPGTNTNSAAAAGNIGENISQAFSAVAVTGSLQNLASISLTAGDWEVTGNVIYNTGAGSSSNFQLAAVSTTSAALPSIGQYAQSNLTIGANNGYNQILPVVRISLASTTTVYAVGQAGVSGTVTATGYLYAKRVR